MKKLLLITLLLSCISCTSEPDASRVLEAEGYTDIELLGYNMIACGPFDYWRTKFKAKNRDGKVVTGTVCGGIMTGSVIRY